MNDLFIEPLRYYTEQGKHEHYKNANDYFDQLVEKSEMDVAAHRKTIAEYKIQQEKIANLDKQIFKFKIFRVLLIVAAIIGAILTFAAFDGKYWLIAIGIPIIVSAIWVIIKKVNPPLRDFNNVLEAETAKANELYAQAEAQMAALNSLFDDTDTHRLIETTIPEFSFDKNFSVKRRHELFSAYQFEDMIDDECSMINLLSGTFMGNPFLYERYLIHSMGSETYEGQLQISWVEYYTDSEGNRVAERKTQTLYATVEKPKPFYVTKTVLYYGCQGAPDLTFSRESQHIENKSDKAIARMVKSGEKQLQKQARKALKEGGSFTEMANSEFDVLFGANDRDNEVQFRMMFTPLAQTNMVKLMKSKDGYGDDFDFYKMCRLNIICDDHQQNWNMNTNAEQYYSYDLDLARDQFLTFNNEYFKSLFFDFAPLFSVPLYQQRPVQSLEAIEFTDTNSSNFTEYEHEVLANCMDEAIFAHEESATDAILKARSVKGSNGTDRVEITAYSYAAIDRVDYVSVLGGDGHYHNVPVPWIEYIPIEKTSIMAVKELGLSARELREKYGNDERIANIVDRSAYCHGLFAYALGEEEDSASTEQSLNNIFC